MNTDICPVCGEPYKSSASEFCSNCGTGRPISRPNHCTNPECKNFEVDLGQDERYCDLCGSPTLTGEKVEKLLG